MTSVELQQMYYSIGIIGIVVVVVVISCLALLVRTSNNLRKDSLGITLRQQFMSLQLTIAENEDLANLYQRGLHGFTGLSDTEQTRFFIIAGYAFSHWDEVQRHAAAGQVPEELHAGVLKMIRDFVQYPGVQEFWTYRRHWYPQQTQDLVDQMIKEAPEKARPFYPEPSV